MLWGWMRTICLLNTVGGEMRVHAVGVEKQSIEIEYLRATLFPSPNIAFDYFRVEHSQVELRALC